MQLEYDEESDALFIWFEDEDKIEIVGELWPEELKEHIGLLFGRDKKLIGLEVLFASAHVNNKLLKSGELYFSR